MSIVATLGGETVARSDDTVVVEGIHYFPLDDVRTGLLVETRHRTLCPWKGVARYWTVEARGVVAEHGAWTYRRPSPFARRIRGRVAFWREVQVHEG